MPGSRDVRFEGGVRLKDLARYITPEATWQDLVLPEGLIEQLHEIAEHVRHRAQVHGRWGFGEEARTELGVTALFAGEKGSGRTLAAEVLAHDLGQPLYRIDTTTLTGKYAGETEKNLRALFASAETTDAVLLFDDADALFGKRGDVDDSHDQYENVEMSYLVERMQSYRGLAILKINRRGNIDSDVLRRLRFVLEFAPLKRREG
jgi:SpoVK/Ycf46/Vps4 family AAA+-type ATPase